MKRPWPKQELWQSTWAKPPLPPSGLEKQSNQAWTSSGYWDPAAGCSSTLGAGALPGPIPVCPLSLLMTSSHFLSKHCEFTSHSYLTYSNSHKLGQLHWPPKPKKEINLKSARVWGTPHDCDLAACSALGHADQLPLRGVWVLASLYNSSTSTHGVRAWHLKVFLMTWLLSTG